MEGSRRFNAFDAVSTGFDLVKAHWRQAVAASVILTLPITNLYATAVATFESSEFFQQDNFFPTLLFVAYGIATIFLNAGMIVAMWQMSRGSSRGLRGTLHSVLSKTSLKIAVVSLPLFLAIALGFVLLLIPGLYLAARWAGVLPAMAENGGNFQKAEGRSSELSKGRKLRLNGVFILAAAIAVAFAFAVEMVGLLATLVVSDSIATFMITWAGDAFATVFSAAIGVAIYTELKRASGFLPEHP